MNAVDSPTLTIGPTSGDHLSLAVVELVPDGQQGARDFTIAASVSCDGFRASERRLWIHRSAFDEFLAALRSFEASRIGTATLESMSPGEFVLSIASDSPAHCPTISGTVTGPYRSCSRRYSAQLAFAFTLDSSFIVQLLHDFEHLFSHERSA
jgi:hypothetical protein